ncbi:MAG: transglycosylase SLT domain-containing protein [Acidimicrobiia bacterium]|nr:transglycosylase SLT domain-containing protein [Acidimicrobiia bacterium]
MAITVAFFASFAAFSTDDATTADVDDTVTISKELRARVSAAVLAERLGPVVTAAPAALPATTVPDDVAPFVSVDKSAAPDALDTVDASAVASTAPVATTTTTAAPVTTTTAAPATTTTHTHAPTTTTTAAPAPPPTTTTTAPPAAEPPVEGGERDVEYWRPLVTAYFPADLVEEALSVIDCESNGDPLALNPSSGAAGLFQFIPSTWSWASDFAGWSGANVFDPEANIASAAWLVVDSINGGHSGGAWGHWTCKP